MRRELRCQAQLSSLLGYQAELNSPAILRCPAQQNSSIWPSPHEFIQQGWDDKPSCRLMVSLAAAAWFIRTTWLFCDTAVQVKGKRKLYMFPPLLPTPHTRLVGMKVSLHQVSGLLFPFHGHLVHWSKSVATMSLFTQLTPTSTQTFFRFRWAPWENLVELWCPLSSSRPL